MADKPINNAQIVCPLNFNSLEFEGFRKGVKMITWCDKLELKIQSDIEPCCGYQVILPSDDVETKQKKKEKPFINKRHMHFYINYLGDSFVIPIAKGYCWDGATIPRFLWRVIGSKESAEFLNASLIHDVLCENHCYCNNDRQLSSMIFREMLIASGVSKLKAKIMFIAVENFQKLPFNGWGK